MLIDSFVKLQTGWLSTSCHVVMKCEESTFRNFQSKEQKADKQHKYYSQNRSSVPVANKLMNS